VTDLRLAPVLSGLTAGQFHVLSLDVFDTLLWRRVPEPQDMFLVLGNRLAENGKLAGHISAVGFADLRRAGEMAAREKVQAVTGYREVTLADIYAAIPQHIFASGFDKADQVEAELAMERDMLVLDRDLVALMQAAKAAGASVILASDTYFSADELRSFLAYAGFTDDALIDKVYVSCEQGKPKYRDLFDVILKDLGVAPAAMVHVGDSLEADINPCRARGIAVSVYDKWSFSPRVQSIEFPINRPKRVALLGSTGDFGLSGLRSRIGNRPPASLGPALKPFWGYGAAVLAPVFAGYARWAAAAASGKAFGLMREGRFLKRVVEATARQLGKPVLVEELWLSRRAVVRAGLYDDDFHLLPEAILINPGTSADYIYAGLGFSKDDLNGVLPPTFNLAQVDGLQVLTRAIVATPALREKVLARSATQRANLLKGLAKQIDITKPQTVTVLDLGYAVTIQSVLARILEREGSPVKLVGLYVALNDKAMLHMRSGADLRAYLNGEGFSGMTAALLSRTPDVLEHACMCREGSLDSYDDQGNPVFLPNQRDEIQLTQMEATQDGIMAGVAAINGLLGGLDRTPAATPTLKSQIAQIINASLMHPTTGEASALGGWRHEANFDVSDKRRLGDLNFNPQDLEYRGWGALNDLGRHQVYWPAAALAVANPFVASAFAAGLEGTWGPAHLGSGPLLGGLTICPDIGVGFDTKRQGVVPLDVNAFGRGEIQALVKPFGPEAYWRLRLTWPSLRAVAQIDSVSAVYVGERERRPATLRNPVWSGALKISGGVYFIEAGKSVEAIIALDTPPSWPHALELIIRYKYLRLDPLFGTQS